MSATLHDRLRSVELLARGSKLMRWRARPLGYPLALLHRELVYPRQQRGLAVNCTTFFGAGMQLLLPSGTDIYLTGGKTHESELRLARYLIDTLQPSDVFVDVGAHYGYFSLLASRLVGRQGRVVAIEASPTSYSILKRNVAGIDHIIAKNIAVSAATQQITFYDFPARYAEYSSFAVEQYIREPWYADNQPTKITVAADSLDNIVAQHALSPTVIKIDVEGAEASVIAGAHHLLQRMSPTIVMEYLAPNRHNESHRRAEKELRELGYTPYSIDSRGVPRPIDDVAAYFRSRDIESDNIVFKQSC